MTINLNAFIPGTEDWNGTVGKDLSTEQLAVLKAELDGDIVSLPLYANILSERMATFKNLYTYYNTHKSFDGIKEVIPVEKYTGSLEAFSGETFRRGLDAATEGVRKILVWIAKMVTKFCDWIRNFFKKSAILEKVKKIKSAAKSHTEWPVRINDVIDADEKAIEAWQTHVFSVFGVSFNRATIAVYDLNDQKAAKENYEKALNSIRMTSMTFKSADELNERLDIIYKGLRYCVKINQLASSYKDRAMKYVEKDLSRIKAENPRTADMTDDEIKTEAFEEMAKADADAVKKTVDLALDFEISIDNIWQVFKPRS